MVQLSLRTGRRRRWAPSNDTACSQGKLPHVEKLQPGQEQQKPQCRELGSLLLTAVVAGPPLRVSSISADRWSSSSNPTPPVRLQLLYFTRYKPDVFFFFLSVGTCIGFTQCKL